VNFDFLVLSLPESAYLYLGLALQAFLRLSSLRHLPRVLVLGWIYVLFWRAQGHPRGYVPLIGYVATSLLIVIFFWPDMLPFGRNAERLTDPSQVGSYAASQDPGAEVISAADTPDVPMSMQAPVLIPPGYRLLLRIVTETPLALARVINSQAHRTFAQLMPLSWFLEVKLPADQAAAVGDWTQSCYIPTLLELLNGPAGRTVDELLPFGNSPVRQQLALHSVVPSAQTGIVWIKGPNPKNLTPCDVYLSALELQAQSWLSELKSPAGTSYLDLFQQELGLDAPAQADLLLYREMLKAAGPAVPAPSLAAQYATLRGTSLVGSVLEGAGIGATAGGLPGAGWGALAGLFRGTIGEMQRSLDGLSWLVRTAMILVWYAPYVLGIINMVLIGLFPFVVLWALWPGQQLMPLALYAMTLLFTYSSPLWFALVDQATKIATQQPPTADGSVSAVWQAFVSSGLWVASITAIALPVIALVLGMIYFALFRNILGFWRGGV
jgi:hypothetical protein